MIKTTFYLFLFFAFMVLVSAAIQGWESVVYLVSFFLSPEGLLALAILVTASGLLLLFLLAMRNWRREKYFLESEDE